MYLFAVCMQVVEQFCTIITLCLNNIISIMCTVAKRVSIIYVK